MDISHLLFANDALVFFYADLDQLRHLQSILLCFEAVSGLPIIWLKSEMVPLWKFRLVLWLVGFQISTLPMKYLGLHLDAPYKSCRIWDGIL